QLPTPESRLLTITNGGRVMAITSYGNTMQEALQKSFTNAERIQYKNKYQ
ncbi:MAG: phosphoribosylamine--glycine ligase, partial [Nitrospinae bacterium]|nr:phosphoribosylamine--glycine ligase [Nitrospinota bacterium]